MIATTSILKLSKRTYAIYLRKKRLFCDLEPAKGAWSLLLFQCWWSSARWLLRCWSSWHRYGNKTRFSWSGTWKAVCSSCGKVRCKTIFSEALTGNYLRVQRASAESMAAVRIWASREICHDERVPLRLSSTRGRSSKLGLTKNL